MLIEIFPIKLCIIINNFNNIYYYSSFIWIWQITLALLHCITAKIYYPSNSFINNSNNFSFKQLKIYLITQMILYFIEIILTDILITKFERFSHHVFAILLFGSVLYQPIIICFNFVLPIFIHAIYWLISESVSYDQSNYALMVYNASLIICCSLIFKECFWTNKNLIHFRSPLFATCLFYVNMMGYFYDYNINLKQLDNFKFFKSIIFSLFLTFPIFSCFIYLHFRNKKTAAIIQV
jgi:hypothetical protein